MKTADTNHLELNILCGLEQQEETTYAIKSEQQLLKTLRAIDWQVFHIVTLSRSETDWVQIGGSIDTDGLAAVYQVSDEMIIKDTVPRNDIEIEDYFLSFYAGNQSFKKERPYWPQPKVKRTDQSKTPQRLDYNLAKKIKISRWQERRLHILSLIFVLFVGYMGYAIIYDELRFIGQHTIEIDALVIDAKYAHFGKGKLYRRATYEYTYDGKAFTGKFNALPSNSKGFRGCKVRIKVSKRYPHRSKVLAKYKSCNDLPYDRLELPAWLNGPKTTIF
ncbi:MAG: hypothetical protein LAT76_11170 [Schleiferiaceae bacterium]|nr:hypothetical protein [Schleiferiaceae bacterium]